MEVSDRMKVDVFTFAAAVGTVLIGLIAGAVRSYRHGWLKGFVDEAIGTRNDNLDEKLNSIHQDVEETYDETKRNGEHIDEVAEAIVLLHSDDEDVDERELRERLEVEDLDRDLFVREGAD